MIFEKVILETIIGSATKQRTHDQQQGVRMLYMALMAHEQACQTFESNRALLKGVTHMFLCVFVMK